DASYHRRADQHLAGCGDVWIDQTEEPQVGMTIGNKIEATSLRVVNPTVADHISSVTDEMCLFDVQYPVGVREPHRSLIVQLRVLDIDGQAGRLSCQLPLRRTKKRTLHRHYACD